MKERLKKLRKVLNLTQQEFADRIGISRGNIATYETREGSPGNSVINLICREFNVSEAWLRTGEGEMFVPNPASELEALAKKYDLSHDARVLVEEFVNLKPEMQQVFIDFARKTAEGFRSELPAPAIPAKNDNDPATLEQEADEFAAMAREQFLSEKRRELKASSAKESDVG